MRDRWFLAGLHSFGDACQGPTSPAAVFAALPTYENWVSSLDWQVYFAEEPEPEAEPGSCPANMSMWPRSLLPHLPLWTPSLAIWGRICGRGGAATDPGGFRFRLLVIVQLGAGLATAPTSLFSSAMRG